MVPAGQFLQQCEVSFLFYPLLNYMALYSVKHSGSLLHILQIAKCEIQKDFSHEGNYIHHLHGAMDSLASHNLQTIRPQ